MITYDYEMYGGDSREQPFTIVDETGMGVDVSSAASITYQIADSVGAETAYVTKTLIDGISVVTSMVTVTLDPIDTEGLAGVYYHEMQVVDASGNSFTAVAGQILIRQVRIL